MNMGKGCAHYRQSAIKSIKRAPRSKLQDQAIEYAALWDSRIIYFDTGVLRTDVLGKNAQERLGIRAGLQIGPRMSPWAEKVFARENQLL